MRRSPLPEGALDATDRRILNALQEGFPLSSRPFAEAGEALGLGVYELVFDAGDYLRASGQATGDVLFLDQIPIRFGIPDAKAHYHVPLLISPFAYSTYRGS